MKNKLFFAGMAAMALTFVLVLTGCDNGGGGGGGDDTKATYTGTAEGATYTLTITKSVDRAAYTPQGGDDYELSVSSGSKTSVGTVQAANGSTFTLKPNNSQTSFTATVSPTGGLTGFNGAITWSDNTKDSDPPSSLTPSGGGSGGGGKDSITGTYSGHDGKQTYTVTVAEKRWVASAPGLFTDTGTYTLKGNTATLTSDSLGYVGYAVINGKTITVTLEGKAEYPGVYTATKN
jgi:hypothetical protein